MKRSKSNGRTNGHATKPASPPGDINMQIGNASGQVVVQFNQPLTSFSMTPGQAREFGALFFAHAAKIEARAEISETTAITALQTEIAAIKSQLAKPDKA